MLGLKFFNKKNNITAISAYELFLTRKSVSKKEPCVFLPDKNNLNGTGFAIKYKEFIDVLEKKLEDFFEKKEDLTKCEEEIMVIYEALIDLESEKENAEFEKSEEKITEIDKILGTPTKLSSEDEKELDKELKQIEDEVNK